MVDEQLVARVTRAAQAELDRQRPELAMACYSPAVARQPEPKQASYELDVTFGPDGKPVTFGINERRDALRSDVAECLRGRRIALEVEPPHAHVRVQLSLSFP